MTEQNQLNLHKHVISYGKYISIHFATYTKVAHECHLGEYDADTVIRKSEIKYFSTKVQDGKIRIRLTSKYGYWEFDEVANSKQERKPLMALNHDVRDELIKLLQ